MQKNINMPIEPGNVIFYCFTSVLDKMIMDQQGKIFDPEMAKSMDDGDAGHYFVVSFDQQYCVVPKNRIDKLGIPSGEQTDDVTACIDHYIKSL